MRVNILSLGSFALSATFGTVEAFWRMPTTSRVTVERLDPLVFPGQVSPHVHTVVGASNFAESNTYENLQESECTSALVSQDKSNYWAPQLYMQLKDGSFESVGQTGGGFLIYYIQRRGNHNNETLYAFPKGFRMISGDPFLRSYSDTLAQQAVNFVCLTYTTDIPSYYGNALPAQQCPDGLRAQVVFPSCWNGKDLDSADHKSHMAFPDGVSTGNCPSTHPYRFITLFYEVTFNVADMGDYSRAKNASQPFVFAQGDPTGYGFHGDFINGWDVDVLQAAVDDCTDDSGVIEYCKHFDLQDYNHQCHKTPTVNEQTTGHLAKLPGNNPVFAGPGRAPIYADNTSPQIFTAVGYDGDVPPIGAPVLASAAHTITNSTGYNYTGCFDEPTSHIRALKNSLNSKISGNFTVDTCMAACQKAGYAYCGVEYGGECWGAPSITDGAEEASIGHCDMACKGDSTQYCGGSGAISIYKATSTKGLLSTNPGPAGSSFAGCYNEGSGSRALTGASTASSNMTVQTCVAYCKSKELLYAGVEYGRECYCGDSFKGNSVLQGTTKDPVSAGCSMTCGGNSTEYCGGSNRLNVYKITYQPEVVESSNGYAYDSCLSDSGSRSLSNSLTSKVSGAMTVDSCLAACRTAGYKYCGLEYGQECWGAAQVAKSATSLADSKCSMACKGDSRQLCGGNNALTFYTASNMKGISALQTTSGTYKSQGCYTEGKNVRALATASFTSVSNMTVDACTSYCSAKGFAYAGLEYARECYCAASIDSSASVATPADDPFSAGCNMPCTGDKSAYCGGSSRLNIYYSETLKKNSVAGVKQSNARQVTTSSSKPKTTSTTTSKAKTTSSVKTTSTKAAAKIVTTSKAQATATKAKRAAHLDI